MNTKDKWIRLPGQKQVKYCSNKGKPTHQKLGMYKGKNNPKEYIDEEDAINTIIINGAICTDYGDKE